MTTHFAAGSGRRAGRHGRRRRRRTVVLVATAAILLLAFDAAWAVLATRSSLESTRRELECGGEAIREGDLQTAVACTARATDSAASAQWFRFHPSVVLGGLLPWIGDDVEAVGSMTSAVGWAASGAASLADAALAAGWEGDAAVVVGPDGVVDLDAVAAAAPGLEGAAADFQQASREIGAIEVDSLVAPLRTAVTDAREVLDPQTRLVVSARDLSWLLPDMLGADGVRRYLLAFQNLSAPRGTGGYLGVVGVLEAVGGRVSLASLDPVGDVPVVPPVPVPDEIARRYGPFGVETTMWASNYSPDVQASSKIAMDIWAAAGRPAVDGVVWADTVWMAAMVGASEPVTSAAWPEPITADNLVDILNRQVFETTDTPATNEAQTRIGSDLWASVLANQADPQELATAMSTGTRSGHFAAFSTSPDTQAILARLGAAGRFELGDTPLAVVWQDAAANRAGYFADLGVSSSVTLAPDGAATVRTDVSMRNEAPDGPPSILLGGLEGGAAPGYWGVDVEVYLPTDAERPRVRVDVPSITGFDEAFGHPVVDAFLYADSGGGATATISYDDPSAGVESDGAWTYATQIRPQPTLRPVTHTLEIVLPEGAEVLEAPEGAQVSDTTVRWTGAPTQPIELVVRYRL
jgi:hypothetical protein